MIPLKLLVLSDDNELTFVREVGKEKLLEYTYTKSITKLGCSLTLDIETVNKKLKAGIFKTI